MLPLLLQNRLAYLTNKCFGDADLEYYIAEAGHILGLKLEEGQGARHVLSEVFQRVAKWKMNSMGTGVLDSPGGEEMAMPQAMDRFVLGAPGYVAACRLPSNDEECFKY
eukprot:914870-Pelagomonas_calceolata.AAC.5